MKTVNSRYIGQECCLRLFTFYSKTMWNKCMKTLNGYNVVQECRLRLYSFYSGTKWNKHMKMVNGNRMNNSHKIGHWNGGCSHLVKSKRGKKEKFLKI